MHGLLFCCQFLACGACGHRLYDVHKSTGQSVDDAQIDGADLVPAEMNTEHPIFGRRPQRDQLATEWFANANATVLESDVSFFVGLAHNIAIAVFDRRQSLRKRTSACPVTLARRRQIERLVRPLVIVDVAPAVEGALTCGQICELAAKQNLSLERAVKPFVLALRLRMMRPAMRDPYSQSQQPHRECRERPTARIAPGRAIVHQHRSRKPVSPEHRHQPFTRWLILLRAAGLYRQCIARMVVNHRQWMTASTSSGEVALEIHLPELVGVLAFEALIALRMLARPLLQLAMPPQNLGDRARRWYNRSAIAHQNVRDLAPTPGIVAVRPNAQNFGFYRRCRSPRAQMRTPRTIGKAGTSFRHITSKPLVAFGTTDANRRQS